MIAMCILCIQFTYSVFYLGSIEGYMIFVLVDGHTLTQDGLIQDFYPLPDYKSNRNDSNSEASDSGP